VFAKNTLKTLQGAIMPPKGATVRRK